MSAIIIMQYIVFLAVLAILAIPLGAYMAKVMNGEKVFLSAILLPLEKLIYKIIGVKQDEEMNWKTYFSLYYGFSLSVLFSYMYFNVSKINYHSIHKISNL